MSRDLNKFTKMERKYPLNGACITVVLAPGRRKAHFDVNHLKGGDFSVI